jgi:hypothetical protein
MYGPIIPAAACPATLLRHSLPGCHPAATPSETVPIPLTAGHNSLDLSVDGLRSDAKTAMDRDTMEDAEHVAAWVKSLPGRATSVRKDTIMWLHAFDCATSRAAFPVLLLRDSHVQQRLLNS